LRKKKVNPQDSEEYPIPSQFAPEVGYTPDEYASYQDTKFKRPNPPLRYMCDPCEKPQESVMRVSLLAFPAAPVGYLLTTTQAVLTVNGGFSNPIDQSSNLIHRVLGTTELAVKIITEMPVVDMLNLSAASTTTFRLISNTVARCDPTKNDCELSHLLACVFFCEVEDG
jgi:hypothetical protein